MDLDNADYTLFTRKVKEQLHLDLGNYKETQMKRRLTTLRDKRGFATFAEYFNAMIRDADLLSEFTDRVTINVSEFWRNPNRWTVLEHKFIPELLAANTRLKCWSAACSTGEEPYTLAMILDQHQANQSDILAVDLDEKVLAKAQEGVYNDRAVRDVPPRYLDKYFTRVNDDFKVVDSLKRMIRFQKGNLLLDRFETNFDLIICRNVMIYFTEQAKHELYHKFAQALRPGGLLFVGSTEQIFTPGQYGLETADSFFYRRSLS